MSERVQDPALDPEHLARNRRRRRLVDQIAKTLFRLCGLISALFIVFIFVFVLQRGISVFFPDAQGNSINFIDFISGNVWQPAQLRYGVLFIIVNTLTSAAGALLLATPAAVLSALFIVKIAPKWLSTTMTTVIELLAAIPSVVYGVFASGVIVLWVKNLALFLGYRTAGGSSMLSVMILLALMIYPTIASLSISAIEAVEDDIEQASLALGASRTQTNFKVVLTSAKSGIFAGIILGLGRAFGEATAVSMVAGNKLYGPTSNLFDITRTLTTTILAGLKETTGLDYNVRFSVGVVLMVVIFISNFLLNYLKRKVGYQSK